MLEQLHIKNIALIENAEIEFGFGLNILSGETGAGKSMIINSINFVLGIKGGKDLMRKGAQRASVSALFVAESEEIKSVFERFDIPFESDNSILITRNISQSGRITNKVNGVTVTVGMIKELAYYVIDIHGQHEHQSLLNSSRHIKLLDKFISEESFELKKSLSELVKEYKSIQNDINVLNGKMGNREDTIKYLESKIKEIEQANIKQNEEEEIIEEIKLLSSVEKINSICNRAMELLYEGGEGGASAADNAAKAAAELEELEKLAPKTSAILDEVNSAYAMIEDASRELSHFMDTIDSDPDRLIALDERLEEIKKIKRKYGGSYNDIISSLKDAKKELDTIIGGEEKLLKLSEKRKSALLKMTNICRKISALRAEKALMLEREIERQLKDLEMKNASFKIVITQKKEITPNGWDDVEFMMSANAGQELKHIEKTASGGEMSRVMLALKTVLSDADNIDTFIFDEIDTGVSGRTAQSVGEKMSFIAHSHQIICITHLPQIAAMADRHFLIEKTSDGSETFTFVNHLDKTKRTNEIARLIGGAKITENTLNAAQEMLCLAEEYKSTNINATQQQE